MRRCSLGKEVSVPLYSRIFRPPGTRGPQSPVGPGARPGRRNRFMPGGLAEKAPMCRLGVVPRAWEKSNMLGLAVFSLTFAPIDVRIIVGC